MLLLPPPFSVLCILIYWVGTVSEKLFRRILLVDSLSTAKESILRNLVQPNESLKKYHRLPALFMPPLTTTEGELVLDFCNCRRSDGFFDFTSVFMSISLVCMTLSFCFIELYLNVIWCCTISSHDLENEQLINSTNLYSIFCIKSNFASVSVYKVKTPL